MYTNKEIEVKHDYNKEMIKAVRLTFYANYLSQSSFV